MTALVKFLITLILSIFLISCDFNYQFNTGVKGNGNVQSEERISNESFSGIKASNGLNVYVTQSTNNTVKVQADENLLDLIKTEIKDNTLHIYTSENIGKCEAKKILVNFSQIDNISTSSGSSLMGTNIIKASDLSLKSSSGSSLEIESETNTVSCKSSSGSTIELSGTTESVSAKASSGSSIKANNLLSSDCSTDASSGASIKVNCSNSIKAESSSGSTIKFSGNPKSILKDKSSGGSISSL